MTQQRWILRRLTCKRLTRSKLKQGDSRQGTVGGQGCGTQTSCHPIGPSCPLPGPNLSTDSFKKKKK